MAKRKKSVQDEAGDEVMNEITYADSNGSEIDEGSGNYTIGDLSTIDMNVIESEPEAIAEENKFSEYEDLDPKLEKKLLKKPTETEEVDDEVNINQDDEFLADANFDPEEKDAQYYD